MPVVNREAWGTVYFRAKQNICGPFGCGRLDNSLLEKLLDFSSWNFRGFWPDSEWCGVYRSSFRGSFGTVSWLIHCFKMVISHGRGWFWDLDKFPSVLLIVIRQVNVLSGVFFDWLKIWRVNLLRSLYMIFSIFFWLKETVATGVQIFYESHLKWVSSARLLTISRGGVVPCADTTRLGDQRG